ncbi:hypothetical protein Y032_0299g1777 [Ancylostoma ceylanicum]|uniref:Uncharacterized protein n=2 Tax=Ancylostoma ceylanicum TaxID=53326 RepID=A0A016S4V5_9BILA|nr:hypothetical protein Y032_0299g1777 [Ancylostoma ceylanicum]
MNQNEPDRDGEVSYSGYENDAYRLPLASEWLTFTMAYTTDITVPIYSVYIVLAAMLSAVVTVAAVFYKSRKPIDLDQLDCEQQAKLFSPQMLAPQLIFDTSPRPVQPHSLKQKLSPWKSASQHVIDSLKPESVSEYRGKLNFSIAFEKEVSTLHVHLLEAVDLPVKDITEAVGRDSGFNTLKTLYLFGF